MMYNVNTQQWSMISDWYNGNWASWKTDCGDYWLHCIARTGDGSIVKTYTIANKYEVSWGYPMINKSTLYWTEAFGWDFALNTTRDLAADSNNDGKVTLTELHNFAYPNLMAGDYVSHEVIYPAGSDYVIYGRY